MDVRTLGREEVSNYVDNSGQGKRGRFAVTGYPFSLVLLYLWARLRQLNIPFVIFMIL